MENLEVSVEFVKQAYAEACDTWKSKLRSAFPGVFSTDALLGKWCIKAHDGSGSRRVLMLVPEDLNKTTTMAIHEGPEGVLCLDYTFRQGELYRCHLASDKEIEAFFMRKIFR